jgi:hypothetical protein
MNIELLYGISLVAAIVIGVLAVKNHWKIADYF